MKNKELVVFDIDNVSWHVCREPSRDGWEFFVMDNDDEKFSSPSSSIATDRTEVDAYESLRGFLNDEEWYENVPCDVRADLADHGIM